jgi:hypothetical protein
MATQTVNSRFVKDKSGVQQLITLEQDTSSGALTLNCNGIAVSAVAPTSGDPANVSLTVSGAAVVINAIAFYELVMFPSGQAAGQQQPPSRLPGEAYGGWMVARLMQASVSLDTILRAGARYIS